MREYLKLTEQESTHLTELLPENNAIIRYTYKQPTYDELSHMVNRIMDEDEVSKYPIDKSRIHIISMDEKTLVISDNTNNLVFAKASNQDETIASIFYLHELSDIGMYGKFTDDEHEIIIQQTYQQLVSQYDIIPESHVLKYDRYIEFVEYMIYIAQLILKNNTKKD